MFKKRRGISEMIAVLLILVIISVAGAALFRTSLGSMVAQYTTFTGNVNDETLAAKERFEVVNVQYKNDQEIIVYLFNYTPDKALTTNVSRIYVGGVDRTWNSTYAQGELPRNEVVKFTVYAPPGKDFSPEDEIVVVSQRGVGYAYP